MAMRRVRERGWILTEEVYVKGYVVLHMYSPKRRDMRAIKCARPDSGRH